MAQSQTIPQINLLVLHHYKYFRGHLEIIKYTKQSLGTHVEYHGRWQRMVTLLILTALNISINKRKQMMSNSVQFNDH